MRPRIRDEKRDIVQRFAAFGPIGVAASVGVALGIFSGCTRESPPTIQVPMISATDDVLDGGSSASGEGGTDAGAVELEPSPPDDAFACRRDVACGATLGGVSPASPVASAPRHRPTAPTAPPSAPSAPSSGAASRVLPSPFEHCALHDDKGRAFSARETRDARLTDDQRCCYVSFGDCVRGKR